MQKQIGYLLAIDAFSHHIWCATIRNKSGPTIRKALETVFDSIEHPINKVTAAISEVSSDQEWADHGLFSQISTTIKLVH